MKTYNEFITEARAHTDTVIKAINKKAKSFNDLDEKDRKKIVDLYIEKAKIRARPGAKEGKESKAINAIDKKIDNFASKFGMSMDDLQDASIEANKALK